MVGMNIGRRLPEKFNVFPSCVIQVYCLPVVQGCFLFVIHGCINIVANIFLVAAGFFALAGIVFL
jgi:hypothetical protein